MKGLIRKDLLQIIRTYYTFLLISLLFIVLSAVQPDNTFFAVYGMFLMCTLVSTLQNLDEAGGWAAYCDTLPVSRKMQVNEKYIFALLLSLAYIVLYLIASVVGSLIRGNLVLPQLFATCMVMAMMGMIGTAISLGMSFAYGMQKSQLARIITIAVIVSLGMLVLNYSSVPVQIIAGMNQFVLTAGMILVSVVILAGSWKFAQYKYEKRDL